MSADQIELQTRSLPANPDRTSMDMRKFIARGALLRRCLSLSKDEATEELRSRDRLFPGEDLDSTYTRHEQLFEEGWKVHRVSNNSSPSNIPDLDEVMGLLGIAGAGGRCTQMDLLRYKHQEGDPHDLYGDYTFFCSPQDGLLVIWASQFFNFPITKPSTDEHQRPERALRHCSDVSFLAWQKHCQAQGQEVSGLKYILVGPVGDGEVLLSVFPPESLEERSFADRLRPDLDSTEGTMLLGTESVHWVLWMLLRQPQMRGKAVKEIGIFGDSPGVDTLPDYDGLCPETFLFIEIG